MAIVSVLATGCSSNDDSMASTPSKITGTVAKGIVINGIVTAYALDASGGETQVGTAITDDKGFYSITLDESYDNSLPIKIKLKPGTNTTMLCDSSAGCGTGIEPGDSIPLAEDSNFELTAISTSVADGETAVASVTPFTNMAASIITNGGVVSDAAVLAATSKISYYAGVPITTTQPVNIAEDLASGTADQQEYTIMLAALAKQVFKDKDSDGEIDIADVIANLEAFNTDAEDEDLGDGGLSLTALYADAATELADAGDIIGTADEITNKLTAQAVTAANNGGVIPFAETTGENPDEVVQAKAFVSEVRTWANSLQDLESPADVFLEEAKTINNTLDSNGKAVFEIAAQSIEAVVKEIDRSIDADGAIASPIPLVDDNGATVGMITLTDNSTAGVTSIAMEATNLSGVDVSGNIGVNSDLDASTFAAGDFVFNFAGTASNSSTRITLEDASFTMTLTEDFVRDQDSVNETNPGGMGLAGKLTVEALNSSGASTGDKISANAEVKFVGLDSSVGNSLANDMNLSLLKLALNDLSVTNTEGSTAGLSASIVMDNAASFDTLTYLNSDSTIKDRFNNDYAFADFDVSAAKTEFGIDTFQSYYYGYYRQVGLNSFYLGNNQPVFNNTINGSTIIDQGVGTCARGLDSSNNSVNFYCIKDQDVSDLNTQIAEKYSGYNSINSVTLKEFHYNDFNGGDLYGYAEIELKDMETAESFLQATINITGKVDLAEHPEAVLSITANKTGFKDGNLTATLAYAGKSLSLTATTAGGDEENTDASLSFSNADGVAMTISKADDWTSGNVTVGNSEVGTIEDLNGSLIMRYNDGTFESL